MKEQGKSPPEQTNEGEIGNLPEKEFRIMIVKMIQDLRKKMEAKIEKMQKMFNKDLEELKNKQKEMNNKIIEMNNTLEGLNSRITEAEEYISDLEDRIEEFIAVEENKEKRMKRNGDSLRDFWDSIKRTKFELQGSQKKKRKRKRVRKYLKRL